LIDQFQAKRYSNGEGRVSTTRQTAAQQRVASANSRRMRYERSVSPPRSSSSSGYGTGSSSRSFTVGGQTIPATSTPPILKDRFPANPEGTMTSTSSGHSSDDPWYDLMPEINDTDPPPLPLRQGPERARGPRPIGILQSHSADSSPNKKTAMPTYSTPPKPKSLVESPILVGRMNNYEDIRTLDRGSAGPQEASKPDAGAKGRPANPPDYHHAMQSRLVALKSSSVDAPMPSMHNKSPSFASRSEDELSAGSTNSLSPHSRRRHNKNTSVDTMTPTSGNSRNQSPRLLVEAKLKSTGSICSGSSSSNKNSQRCSSNLQEDLLRLITPDEEVVTRAHPVACVLSNGSTPEIPAPNAVDEDMDWSRLVDAAARAIQGKPTNNIKHVSLIWRFNLFTLGAATSMVSVPEDQQEQQEEEQLTQQPQQLQQPQQSQQQPKLPSPSILVHPPPIPTIQIDADQQDSLTSWIDDVTEKLRIEAETNPNASG